MCSELHDRLPRAPHIQDLNLIPVHVECRHVVGIGWVERDSEEWGRGWTSGSRWRSCWGWDVLGCRCFVEDGGMLKTSEIKGSQTAIGSYGYKDVCRLRKPGDIVHLPVVGDELGHGALSVEVPYCTCGIDGGRDNIVGVLLVPGEVGQWCSVVLCLSLGLL